MFPDDPPVVLRRSRAWLLQLLAWRVVIALSALSLVWSTQDLSMPGPLRWTLVGVVALLAVRPSRDLSRTLSIDSIYLERGFSNWAWAYLTSVHLSPRPCRSLLGAACVGVFSKRAARLLHRPGPQHWPAPRPPCWMALESNYLASSLPERGADRLTR
jgi:hypothetical protein